MGKSGRDLQSLPLYIGGLMGPFGTVIILPMFPELRDTFGATDSQIAWGFTIYMIPFAVALLFSGTLGERWGRRRTVQVTYLMYAAASAICALAPTLELFLAGRAFQGLANAFITPLLIAGLAESVAPERFGRAVGIYSSFQAAGGALGPLIGGLAADTNWRFAFAGTALVALLLATAPPPGAPRVGVQRPPIRPLLTRQMIVLSVGFMAASAGPTGINVVVGVFARDELQLDGTTAGLILLGGPVLAMLTGPWWGRLLDRTGQREIGVAGATLVTLVAACLVFADGPWRLAGISALIGALTGLVVVVFQAAGSTVVPDNRGGALSFILAFRFVGHGIGPLIFVPMLSRSVDGAFLSAAALGIVTVIALSIAVPRRQHATTSA